jgi:hypothetical protein
MGLADNKLSIALVMLVPALSLLIGLSMDFCLCCYHLRRRRAAQRRLSQVKQVITLYTVLRRAVRFKRSSAVKSEDIGEDQVGNGGDIGGDGSGSGGAGWLTKTVIAMIGIKRLGGGRKQGRAVVSNRPNVPADDADACTLAESSSIADASCSADVTMLDESASTGARQAGLVLAEGTRCAVVSPIPAVTSEGNLAFGSEITTVDEYNHSLDSDAASSESAQPMSNAVVQELAQSEPLANDRTDDVSDFIVPGHATLRKT